MKHRRVDGSIPATIAAAMWTQSAIAVAAVFWGLLAAKGPLHEAIAAVLLVLVAGAIVWFALAARRADRIARSEEPLRREEARVTQVAEHRGYFDDLTGLPARPWFDYTLRTEMARAKRYRHALSQVVLSIDRFSRLNAAHGSAGGDYVLMTIADLLRSTVRMSDQIARVADDEFVVVVPETDVAGAQIVGEKLRRAIELYPFDEGLEVTVSIGIALVLDTDSPESFFARGETAARAARARGGNACVVANE